MVGDSPPAPFIRSFGILLYLRTAPLFSVSVIIVAIDLQFPKLAQ